MYDWPIVPLDLLERLAALAPAPQPTPPPRAQAGDSALQRRARAYLDTLPDSVAGEHGHDRLYHAACVLIDGFAFDFDQAYPILSAWNQSKAFPPESDAQLRHKLQDASKNTPRSGHLRDTPGPDRSHPQRKSGPNRPHQAEPAEGELTAADINLVQLSTVQSVPVQWLWKDRIPRRKITLIAGEAKLGKSFLTIDLAARVSIGGEAPGTEGERIPHGTVILLSAEDDLDDTVKPRLEAAGADTSKVHALTTIRLPGGEFGPFNLTYLPYLELAVQQFPDTRLIIIDPVPHYLGMGTDDNKNAQLRAVLGPLRDMASRRDVAVVIVTHLNKGTGVKALNRVIGSSAYTAISRANWLVIRDPTDRRRRLFLDAGNNLAEDPRGLAYRLVQGRLEWEPDSLDLTADEALAQAAEQAQADRPARADREAGKVEQAEAWLLDLLAGGRELASEEIMDQGKAHGFSRPTLFRAKERSGVLARKLGFRGGWVWYLQVPDPDPNQEPPIDWDKDRPF